MTNDVRALPGLRFSCRSCADCCSSGFDLGPVEPAVIDDLRASGIEALWPPAAEAPWSTTRPGPDGQPLHFLRQRDGACVFLRDDRLCAVHALLGADRKPGFCQEFPYHLVEEPRGWVAVTRPTCGGLHRSHADGEAVDAQALDAVRSLARVSPRRRFAPASVEVLPGLAVPLDQWLGWEDQILDLLHHEPDLSPDAAVAAVRGELARLAMSAGHPALPPARPAQALAGAQAVLFALERVMQQVLAQGAGGPPDRVAFAREAAERLPKARARLERPTPLAADASAYVHELLRSQLLAKQWEAWGSVHAGLGQFLLGVHVGRALAEAPTADGFADPYRHWLRFAANGMIQHVLRSARAALTDVFLHVA
jgi:hypothetical protein